MDLNTDVRFLKGIGEQRAVALGRLGIHCVGDLLAYFPRSYDDRTHFSAISSLTDGQTACVRGIVSETPTLSRVRKGMELVKLRAVDDTGVLYITYFNQSYVRNQLRTGESYVFYGKVTVEKGRRQMSNPVYEKEDSQHSVTGRIVPIYRLTAGVSQKLLMGAVRRGLDECANQIADPLPEAIVRERKLCRTPYAYENIHFPADPLSLDIARRRLIFEELFVLACALDRMRAGRQRASGRIIKKPDLSSFLKALSFTLTGAQLRAVDEALADMASGHVMNRLVQGDVGSGKTMVAAACMWAAGIEGFQSALMAPTEILATQHFRTLSALLEPLGLKTVKLTGSMKAKEKREAKALLESGEAAVAVGTHALISEDSCFKNLNLVVTDEQHRFGVEQRAKLAAKGGNPHMLVMSATPIPRTMALMIYGDLDVSVIDELPPGRQKVDTFVVGEDMRQRINRFIRRQVEDERQVFIVCPAVEENEEAPEKLKSATEHAFELQRDVFPDLRIDCVHGKMKSADKDGAMLRFLNGETDILVSTTVIEVGVDVPNASLIVVENAGRFGLSQLHQLRGRVGRGSHKSYCVLFSEGDSPETTARLKVMEKINNGFVISEEDLKLRGPGDFFGSRQHGLPEMHIADLCADVNLLKEAQAAAKALLASDPLLEAPENAALRERTEQMFLRSEGTMN